MSFNEDTRVKIPTIIHLTRLGYTYLPLKGAVRDSETNIFTDIFKSSLLRINQDLDISDAERILDEISLSLDNEDLGKAFYQKLIERSGVKLVDFENFENNTFNVVTELSYKKDDEEFRPDVILLINGMPLVFIEVKKPNNKDGTLAEKERIDKRFKNKKFRKFINITQLMVFSNNMEYEEGSATKIQGSFYASASYGKPNFNYFREEENLDLNKLLKDENDDIENQILKDNNFISIKNSPAFISAKNPTKPSNRICTSLFNKQRLSFLLQYSLAYVNETKGLEKHVMRYPQIFATKAIEKKLDDGVRSGLIWHTQGSGKTALAYYNVKFLIDYYQSKGIVPKFYFIVDRLDLLNQASKEFKSRDLIVKKVSSRDEFAKTIKSSKAIENNSGKPEITVVNIQKFENDPNVAKNTDYNLKLQRIYFLDEVHRSYNPKGSFLANLKESDPNSIKIGLSGTPLLGEESASKLLFGDYIHKYYYNKSIADGYTLRLIREKIETSYVLLMQKALEEIEVLKGKASKEELYADHRFVEPMLNYIVTDFEKSRTTMNDPSIGAMVICDSSKQAKKMHEIFLHKYSQPCVEEEPVAMAAETQGGYGAGIKEESKVTTAALILHDAGTKSERKELVEKFKDGKIDLLIVYNMLLTGFDAKRLKKLYLGRLIKSHNLLQALTRVNRTYKDFKYGYVVDFADIETEFEKTNQAYFDELQLITGDEMESYSDLFLQPEEIEQQIEEIENVLLYFDIENAEIFSEQINEINDREEMLKITRALNKAKSLYNLIRFSGQHDKLERLDFRKLAVLAREAFNRLALINKKQILESNDNDVNILNIALENVVFAFTKINEAELILADQLKDILQKTRESLQGNFDQKDPEFISLKEELERLFKKKNLSEVSKQEMEENIESLNKIHEKSKELERKNRLIKAKYENDEKYARLHKRLLELRNPTDNELKLIKALSGLKHAADEKILQNSKMLNNEDYIEKMMVRIVIDQFKNKHNMSIDAKTSKMINNLIVKEYINEYKGNPAW